MDQNKQRLSFLHRGQDASRGQARIQKQRSPQEQEVYNGGEKHEETEFEVERSTPEAFLLLEMGSADRGVQRIQRRSVSRCNEKRVMAGRTGQETKRKSKAFLADLEKAR